MAFSVFSYWPWRSAISPLVFSLSSAYRVLIASLLIFAAIFSVILIGIWSSVSAHCSIVPQYSTRSLSACEANVRSIVVLWAPRFHVTSPCCVRRWKPSRVVASRRWSPCCSYATPTPPHCGWCTLKSPSKRTFPSTSAKVCATRCYGSYKTLG